MLKKMRSIIASFAVIFCIATFSEVIYAKGVDIAADTKAAEDDAFRVELAMVSSTSRYTKESMLAPDGKYIFVIYNKPIAESACNLKYYSVQGSTVMSVSNQIDGLETLAQYAVRIQLSDKVSSSSVLQVSQNILSAAGEQLENGGAIKLPYAYNDEDTLYDKGNNNFEKENSSSVSENPLTVTDPENCSVKSDGMFFSFQVTASGGKSSEYTYTWYYSPSKDGEGVNLDTTKMPFLQKYSNKIVGALNVAVEDGVEMAGYYYCVVSDGVSTVESKRARLTVIQDKQELAVHGVPEKNRVAYKGKFTLHASADGKISYKSSNSKVLSVNAEGVVTAKNYGKAVITIYAAATKKYNAANKKITLSVVPKRVVINKADLVVDDNGQTRLEFTWKQDSTVDVYQYNVAYNTSFTNGMSGTKPYKENWMKIRGINTEKKGMYIRVRGYKKTEKKTLYGDWSQVYYMDLKKIKKNETETDAVTK